MNSKSNRAKNGTYPRFENFGEYLHYSYANLQMLCYAIKEGKDKYDRSCYMVRAKAFKAYKEGRWNIHNLLENNRMKIQCNNLCWYCGEKMEPNMLTIDHVFPRSKGGSDDMDNIIMVCKSCNSSKGNMDLFRWYCEVRDEFPSIPIIVHYMKNIYQYSVENKLLDKHADELDNMELPFEWRYIPMEYPEPGEYK